MTHAVNYTLGFDDYLASIRVRAASGMFGRHVRWVRGAIPAGIFLAIMIGLAISDGTINELLHDSRWLGLMLGGTASVIFFGLLIDFLCERVVYRWLFGRFAMANADLVVTLNAEGMHWNAPSRSGTLGWPAVRRVVTTLDYIFLFVSKIEVIALPRRAFATENAFNEAARYCAAQADAATRTP